MDINEFNELVKEGTTIVDFWAEWCGPCKMVTPVLEELASEQNVNLIKIDVDSNQELATHFGVTGIPAIMVYNNGVRTKSIVGAKPKPAMKKALFD